MNRLKGRLQNGTCQHMPSGGVPVSWREAFQYQQVGLTQSPFKLRPLHWDSELVRGCTCPLRLESLFPTVLWLSHMQAPLAFKARCSGVLSSQCKAPGLGIPMRGSEPLLLGENLCNCDYPSMCGSPTWECWS